MDKFQGILESREQHLFVGVCTIQSLYNAHEGQWPISRIMSSLIIVRQKELAGGQRASWRSVNFILSF